MIFTIKTDDEVSGLSITAALVEAGIFHTILSKQHDSPDDLKCGICGKNIALVCTSCAKEHIHAPNGMIFEKEYIGDWQMKCDMTDLNGNHCPEKVTHINCDNGTALYFCEKCHQNYVERFLKEIK